MALLILGMRVVPSLYFTWHYDSLTCCLQLPKATDTSAFSGAGFMRLVKNVGDSISKIGGKKSDTDRVSLLLLELAPE